MRQFLRQTRVNWAREEKYECEIRGGSQRRSSEKMVPIALDGNPTSERRNKRHSSAVPCAVKIGDVPSPIIPFDKGWLSL